VNRVFKIGVRCICNIAKSEYYLRHVCPSVRIEQLGSHWTDLYENWHLNIFRKKNYAEKIQFSLKSGNINPLTPNGPYRGRTAPLTSKRCILCIYSTNIGTEYFKHGIYFPFYFSSTCSLLHNSNVFGSCIIHVLYTDVLKLKKK